MLLLDGKKLSEQRLALLETELKSLNGRKPKLCVIRVGGDPASEIYVKKKLQTAKKIGMDSSEIHLPETVSEKDLIAEIDRLNADMSVDGILVQLPIPGHINTQRVIETVNPLKDVDGFHPYNLGRLASGEDALVACTPLGILNMLKSYDIVIKAKRAVVMGRSRTVGRPMSLLLDRAGATVTVLHRDTKDPKSFTREADILVVAAGVKGIVGAEDIKKGAVVVDVGIHRLADGKIVGDVRFDECKDLASAMTPVPGGVGPLTVCTLLENTLLAHRRRVGE